MRVENTKLVEWDAKRAQKEGGSVRWDIAIIHTPNHCHFKTESNKNIRSTSYFC